MNNLDLWNRVVKTDPAYTKPFRRSGGFEGTAINFAYLARKATEVFGPMGIGWGAEILDEKYVDGAPLPDVGCEVVHVVRIRFWYELDGKKGTIESIGQTTFVGRNKNGVFTDEEAPKKSLTDAMSKAMSWLGFGADIHLGLYDDNKYVADLRREYAEPQAKQKPAKPGLDEAALAEEISKISSKEEFESARKRVFSACKDAGDAEAWNRLKVRLAARAKEIGHVPERKGNGAANQEMGRAAA